MWSHNPPNLGGTNPLKSTEWEVEVRAEEQTLPTRYQGKVGHIEWTALSGPLSRSEPRTSLRAARQLILSGCTYAANLLGTPHNLASLGALRAQIPTADTLQAPLPAIQLYWDTTLIRRKDFLLLMTKRRGNACPLDYQEIQGKLAHSVPYL